MKHDIAVPTEKVTEAPLRREAPVFLTSTYSRQIGHP